MREEFAKVVEIRNGRHIYLRKVVLDGVTGSPDSLGATTTTVTTERPNLQMIFVHGICGTEQQYQLVLQSMDDQLRVMEKESSSSFTTTCWLYDQVGCGQSPMLPNYDDYSNEENQADLKALLLAEQNQKNDCFPTPSLKFPTILVGHSYGPSIFIPLLLSEPNLLPILTGLILISTSVRCPSLPMADGGHVVMRLPIVVLQCLQSQLTESFITMAVHPKHTELQDIIRTASQKNNMFVAKSYHRHAKWMTMSQLLSTVWRSRTAPQRNQPSQSTPVPTVIIHGTDDGVTPIECGQYMYNELLSRDRSSPEHINRNEASANSSISPPITFVPIDIASHMVPIEQPDATAQTILNFMLSLSY
jgi:pimeloyl-ACP methyl ester carboxylesterase